MTENDLPLVSIIVPIYNTEPFLEKCVRSLIDQTYVCLEIILVDDGSPDNCAAICDTFAEEDSRIRVIHKSNGGLSDARNAGLDIATGKYISFVDSDDYLDSEAIELLVQTAWSTGCSIAHMKSYIVDSEYNVLKNQSNNTHSIRCYTAVEYIQGVCEKRFSESVCDKLFDASLLRIRRFEKGRLNEDFYFLSLLLLEGYDVAEIDYSGYHYYQRAGSITNSGFGPSLVDSVKNACELKRISRVICPAAEKHFARLTLYQAKTVFITMPWEYTKNERPEYTETLAYMRECIPFLNGSSISKVDKYILTAINIAPKLFISILSKIWRYKK